MPEKLIRAKLELPGNAKKLLLHSCCAPCSGELMEALVASEINYTIFFYNPNIHPRKEYEIRKEDNIRFAQKMNVPFVDADYDTSNWFARVKGLEFEPERGVRCSACLYNPKYNLYYWEHLEYRHPNTYRFGGSILYLGSYHLCDCWRRRGKEVR